MKYLLLVLALVIDDYCAFAQHTPYSWSVGVRTGASHELDDYVEQHRGTM